ncbi:MAG TPA: nicotinate (nicotinamide) nucleotide adenylyltransferase [Saprospiraceae bacterium]|nr:nicotinate (nicotinamide) nucleotide adenylyltransferase [Saprospiraceae bacterium]HQW54914.1 nicotinate (nicotinamide) nucleotide adenylyltransferase [Saprospiraceae bacterium]
MNNKIGLFFGSFNPVHIGHMIIANNIALHTDLDQVWMVVSPQNPFKDKKTLARERDRLHLVRLAIGDNIRLSASDIEFTLPQPSYTIDTLAYLHEKYPEKEFYLIMGSDNLLGIHKWKNGELLLKKYGIYIYARPGFEAKDYSEYKMVNVVPGPLLDISSTYIRKQIKDKKSIQYLVPDAVFEYIDQSRLYS